MSNGGSLLLEQRRSAVVGPRHGRVDDLGPGPRSRRSRAGPSAPPRASARAAPGGRRAPGSAARSGPACGLAPCAGQEELIGHVQARVAVRVQRARGHDDRPGLRGGGERVRRVQHEQPTLGRVALGHLSVQLAQVADRGHERRIGHADVLAGDHQQALPRHAGPSGVSISAAQYTAAFTSPRRIAFCSADTTSSGS